MAAKQNKDGKEEEIATLRSELEVNSLDLFWSHLCRS